MSRDVSTWFSPGTSRVHPLAPDEVLEMTHINEV